MANIFCNVKVTYATTKLGHKTRKKTSPLSRKNIGPKSHCKALTRPRAEILKISGPQAIGIDNASVDNDLQKRDTYRDTHDDFN